MLFAGGSFVVSAITATEVNAPSAICRVRRARGREGISASPARGAGNWRRASVIRSARKGSSSLISAARSATTTVALVKVDVDLIRF